jgi:hypothetical protein
MNKKQKAIAAIAASAVVLALGTSAVSCSINSGEGEGAVQAQEQSAQSTPNESSTTEASSASESASEDVVSTGFAALANTTWTGADTTSKLSITKDTLIETTEGGVKVMYFTIEDETTDATGISTTLNISNSLNGDGTLTVARIEAEGSTLKLTCDVLSTTYTQDAKGETAIEITGDITELANTFGKDKADFKDALTTFAKTSSPYATSATWDKEVWVDFDAGTRLTTFTLNDAASTIVTITLDPSGEMTAV